MSLRCKVNANPMQGVNINWYKDGAKIEFSEARDATFSMDNSQNGFAKLKFTAMPTSTDGKYACSAENNVGKSDIIDIAMLQIQLGDDLVNGYYAGNYIQILTNDIQILCLSSKLCRNLHK